MMSDSTGNYIYCGLNNFPSFYWFPDNFEKIHRVKTHYQSIFLIYKKQPSFNASGIFNALAKSNNSVQSPNISTTYLR